MAARDTRGAAQRRAGREEIPGRNLVAFGPNGGLDKLILLFLESQCSRGLSETPNLGHDRLAIASVRAGIAKRAAGLGETRATLLSRRRSGARQPPPAG